jgi:hypothetical protein
MSMKEPDVAALRRIKAALPPEDPDLLQALYDALPEAARLPRRTTSAGWESFEL